MSNKTMEESNLNSIENITKKIMKDEVDFKVDKNLENNDLTNLDIIEKFCDNSKLFHIRESLCP